MSCWLDVRPCEVYIPEKPMADSHRLLRHFYQPVVTTTHSAMDSIRGCLDTPMVSRLSKMPERNNDPQLFTSTRQRPSQIVSILASVNTCKSEMKNIYPRNVKLISSFLSMLTWTWMSTSSVHLSCTIPSRPQPALTNPRGCAAVWAGFCTFPGLHIEPNLAGMDDTHVSPA